MESVNDVVLIINAGSSSIKLSLFKYNNLELIFYAVIENISDAAMFSVFDNKHVLVLTKNLDSNGYEYCLHYFFNWFRKTYQKLVLKGTGHRIVHGGAEFLKPAIINDDVIAKLIKLIPLAPLHQPNNLEAIRIVGKIFPNIIQVCCFDTAFHCTQNKLARLFAIPRRWTEEGMVRYGFHGLSYEYIASILPQYLDVLKARKIIVAHLGNGASVCSLFDLKSLATSMGLTPLDGLMMGTRSGAIDPGLILYLLQENKVTKEQMVHMLYNESGLLGVSRVSSDLRVLLTSQKKEAIEAIDLFCYRAAQEIAAQFVILKGCDAIVFTGGIGENSPFVRQKICEWLDWVDIHIDNAKNNGHDTIISDKQSKVIVAILPTNEDYMIAQHTKFLITRI